MVRYPNNIYIDTEEILKSQLHYIREQQRICIYMIFNIKFGMREWQQIVNYSEWIYWTMMIVNTVKIQKPMYML